MCSLNYLAQAKTLGASMLEHNPEYTFIIGLVDRVEGRIRTDELAPLHILEAERIGIPDFGQMVDRYNIVELNTSVKPFYIEYFFRHYQAGTVIYLDPDIYVYHSFAAVEAELAGYNLLLTPHVTTPVRESCGPRETMFLNFGLYNLGFIALRNTPLSRQFVSWWQDKLKEQCLAKVEVGLYVDQLWVNFAPLYFEGVGVSTNLGLNMAYWNFHERTLTQAAGGISVNDAFPLVFFHFSSYNPEKPGTIARYTNCTFTQKPDVYPLFEKYRATLLQNGYAHYRTIECAFVREKRLAEEARLQKLNATFQAKTRRLLTVFFTFIFDFFPESFKKIIARSLRLKNVSKLQFE